ncbi:MAG: hypothetical protein B6I26_05800 [Desulfobacteraceae bacterium 4572_130]|nr:MAG: hypothetical protein B6I26_05800 [Desulfobacteraceae bacterium 4572_130]
MKKNIFISYSRYDTKFVDKLSNDLRQKGIDVWIDRENILPGEMWQKQIGIGLNMASALIFVISRHSIQSQWMLHEVTNFLSKNKKIFPILIDDVDASKLPIFLSNIQWVDFKKSYSKGFNLLLSGLGVSEKDTFIPIPSKIKKSKGYVFLSYVEEDSDFISSLKNFLKEHKYSYWDYEESDRDYHSQLFLELESVIIEASATLSVLSEDWKRSHWTIKEFFFSQEVHTPVFLLKAKNIRPTLAIAGMTYIDFIKNKNKGFEKLHRELIKKKL